MRQEHPFAAFIRAIGTGPGRARPLSEAEAFEAARMMLIGTARPAQIGAFLMLMRYRKETPAELAGFVRAARASADVPVDLPAVALDWPSYASGSSRGAPYYVLAALLVAGAGVPVLMHGLGQNDAFGGQTEQALADLGIAPAANAVDAARRIERDRFAFLPLAAFHPGLRELLDLRLALGLRSPANTVARLTNPFRAEATISGVFHPGYRVLQREAASLLGENRLGVFKGGGGEAERNPAKPCAVYVVENGRERVEDWPALLPDAPLRLADAPAPPSLAALWLGEWHEPHAVAAVTGTAAIALRLAGRATASEADDMARSLWRSRARLLQEATAA